MPRIHLIPGLPALLVITRFRDGEVLVLVDAGPPTAGAYTPCSSTSREQSEARAWLASLGSPPGL